jgi:hypothetical protein
MWPVSAFSAAGDTFFTGDMLHKYCRESSENCTSYVAGVVDALIAVGAAQKAPLICLHDRTDLRQAVRELFALSSRETARERCEHGHCSFGARVPL